MKVMPINYAKITNFQGKPKIFSAPFKDEDGMSNAEAFGLTCLLTVIPGVEIAKKGFKNASAIGKMGLIAKGAGATLGLSAIIFGVLKSFAMIGASNKNGIEKTPKQSDN